VDKDTVLFADLIDFDIVPELHSPIILGPGATTRYLDNPTEFTFEADHFPANDPNYAWDGTLKGMSLNSAVFAYKLIVEFNDGRSEVRYGAERFSTISYRQEVDHR